MTSTRTTAVTVRLGNALANQLTDQAQSEDTNCADIMRRALQNYLAAREQRAMLEDVRQTILAKLESVERSIVAEISSLVELDQSQGGMQ